MKIGELRALIASHDDKAVPVKVIEALAQA